jgi:hypothetical protein
MELIAGFVLAVVGIVAAALSRQLADEFKAWMPWIIGRLVRRAVRKLPDEQQNRYAEEWFAHINEIPGEIGKLIAALGVLSASRSMSTGVTLTKRAATALLTVAAIAIDLPVFVIVAMLIKLDDGGPIIVKRAAKGVNGRTVLVFKFRTVALDGSGQHSRVGRHLQSWHVDEHPTLINYFRGDVAPPKLRQIIAALRASLT